MSASPAASDVTATPRLALRAAGASDPGRVRENNEDRFHSDPERGIFIVVDGVGGHAGGETAAETALLQVRTRLERNAGTPEERLREAITLANNEVLRLSRTNDAWEGMSCVLTAALVQDSRVVAGHVGDSRLYKLRRGTIEKLTHDHSPIGEREDAGEIDELTAMRHPRRNEVFRDVGSAWHTPGDSDFVEIVSAAFEPDAALVLCSDGLSDLLTSRELIDAVAPHRGHPDLVVRELIARANDAGGRDNVTVVYVEGPAVAGVGATRRSRGVLGYVLALAIGIAAGAAAAAMFGDRIMQVLPELLPAAPVTAGTEEPRAPRTLHVQQAAAAEFATIGAALRAAAAGDTVVVGPGEYLEPLRLASGVTLVSEVRHRAVIRIADAAGPAPGLTVDGARNVRLQGFQIVGEPGLMPIGVLVLNGEVEVQDTRITGASESAVDIWGGTSVTLRANDIADNRGAGVRVRTGARASLFHNAIVRNGRARQPAPGVLLEQGALPVLAGNVIADNGAHGIAGLPARAQAEILRNNVFVANGRANARGALGVLDAAAPTRR